MTCKLYREASFFKHDRNEGRKYQIIHIVNQIYLVHLHGLHSGVKKKKDKKKKQLGFGCCYSIILSKSF